MTRKVRGLELHCGGPLRVRVRIWCRRGESNPRPRDYETLALPLSYAGPKGNFHATKQRMKVSRTSRKARYSFVGLEVICLVLPYR